MTYDEVADAIISYFRTNWTTTPVLMDNQPGDVNSRTAWTRISVQFNTSTQMSIGSVNNRMFRRFGTLLIEVYTPKDTFTYTNTNYCDTINALFEGKQISGITFQNTHVETIGLDFSTYEYQQNVISEFYFEIAR